MGSKTQMVWACEEEEHRCPSKGVLEVDGHSSKERHRYSEEE